MPIPEIKPDRFEADGFVIRSYEPGDGLALRDSVRQSYEHLQPWMPWAQPDPTLEEAEGLCRRFRADYLLNKDFVLGAWVGRQLAAGTGFHLRQGSIESGNAEIGMWVNVQYAGKGFGTRLLGAMLEWGFNDWGWDRLCWRCDPENRASIRVAEKCGLKLEGTFRKDSIGVDGDRRDTHLFAILREDWSATNQIG
jgi:RimJ/RimL family protein N-acetyltransferase